MQQQQDLPWWTEDELQTAALLDEVFYANHPPPVVDWHIPRAANAQAETWMVCWTSIAATDIVIWATTMITSACISAFYQWTATSQRNQQCAFTGSKAW
jgi:hypothetical protein